LVGNDREVIVIDAAHDAAPIVDAINGRRVKAIALTHGHNDHINAAMALQDVVDAPILLHPDDLMLWQVVYPDSQPDGSLTHGGILKVAATDIGVLHTPGHSPGGCCFHVVGATQDGGEALATTTRLLHPFVASCSVCQPRQSFIQVMVIAPQSVPNYRLWDLIKNL
jgi:glyoxylase-like metal-dependent hydrolase (beta-lactamase superfamily II)